MSTGNNSQYALTRPNRILLVGVFIIVAAILAVPVYSVRSTSLPTRSQSNASIPSGAPEAASQVRSLRALRSATLASILIPLLTTPQAPPEGITTYADDCVTPKSDFNLGDTVCAKASGVPATVFPWRVTWVDPAGFIRQSDTASTNSQTEYRYMLPSTATSDVGGRTVDNRGTWKVNLVRSNGAVRQTAPFTVHQPANPVSDVFVQKLNRNPNGQVSSGGNIDFILVVGNSGPDTASVVHLIDSVPTGGTLVQFTQQSGPTCVPPTGGPANDCTIATMVNGERAEFTAVYNTGSAAPGTYETSATVSSATTDPDISNNTWTAQYTITAGNGGAAFHRFWSGDNSPF